MRRYLGIGLFAFLIALVALIGFPAQADAALVFHSGFEMGDLSEWSSVTGSPSVERLVGIDQKYDGATSSQMSIYDVYWRAQTFTTARAYTVKYVFLRLSKLGLPGTLTVSIQGVDGSSHPDGSDIAAGTYDGDTLTSADKWVVVSLGSGAPLSNSTMYAIVLRAISGSESNWVTWRYSTVDPYAGGAYESSVNSGVSWATTSNCDFAFIVGTSLVKTGDYAMRSNTTNTTAYAVVDIPFVYRASFYIYISSAPSAETKIFGQFSVIWYGNIRLTQTGYLKLYNGDVDLGTSSTPLSTEQWYRISIAVESGVGSKVWINGTEKISSGTYAQIFRDQRLGIIDAVTADIYFDNFVLDGNETLADLSDIRVLRGSPNDTGEHADYDTSSGFGNVDEFPANDGDFVEDEGGDAAKEAYNIEDTTDIGIGGGDTINAVTTWTRGDRDGGGGTDHMILVRDDGVDYLSPDLDFDGIAWYSRYDAVLPNGGGAWTPDRYNAYQIGAYHSGAQDQRVHCMVVMVAYTPGVACAEDITNSPASYDFGSVAISTTTNTTINYFTVTNNSGGAIDITVYGTNMTGGTQWTLADDASPGSDIVGIKAGLDDADDNYDVVVKLNTPYNTLITGLADSGTQDWGLELHVPTSFSDEVAKSGTITISASCN